MSLISGRNLISPFTNKVHLVTILVLALAFGIFRLLGGGLTVEPMPPRQQSPSQSPFTTSGYPASQNQYQMNSYGRPAVGVAIGQGMGQPINQAQAVPPAWTAAGGTGNKASMNDIERMLGGR